MRLFPFLLLLPLLTAQTDGTFGQEVSGVESARQIRFSLRLVRVRFDANGRPGPETVISCPTLVTGNSTPATRTLLLRAGKFTILVQPHLNKDDSVSTFGYLTWSGAHPSEEERERSLPQTRSGPTPGRRISDGKFYRLFGATDSGDTSVQRAARFGTVLKGTCGVSYTSYFLDVAVRAVEPPPVLATATP